MKFITKIREKLGLNPYKMQKELGIKSTQTYIVFENAKSSVSLKNLVKLWRVSGMDAHSFLEMIEEEVLQEEVSKKSKTHTKKK
ncbi:helix-turn-helix transcriptional regulator [Nostoc linckia FACHB-104]|nr:helix-turn-helix transcriptional regulator [Nostoc linckia FACHB-104]